MLKHLIIATAAICCAPALTAQNTANKAMPTTRTITGMVVDKNGNPLSGAEVRATGGAETVYTEADGSYTIEVPITLKSLTASYTGLKDSKLRTTSFNNMIFTLKPVNTTHGFVNLVGGFSKVIGSEPAINGVIPQLGVMGGAYRKWGGYAKVVIGFLGPTIYSGYGYDESFPQLPLITGGVIRRLSKNVNLLVGAGAGANYNVYNSRSVYTTYNSTTNAITDIDSYGNTYAEADWAAAVELALMYHYKKVNILIGATYVAPCFSKEDDYYKNRWDDTWDNTYRISEYWYTDNQNNGNINLFVSVGLHI